MKAVVIVGGGAIGLWSAWHLLQAGRQVTIIDKGDFTDGCSYGNAGMIVPSHFIPMASPGVISKGIQWMFKRDSPFYIRPRLDTGLVRWLWSFYRSSNTNHVADSIELLRDLHTESRELYKNLDKHHGFDFGFQQKGILMLYKSISAERDELEMADQAHRLGIEAVHLTAEALSRVEPVVQISVRGAVHYPGDAHIVPHEFMRQMIQYLKRSGVEFLQNSEVVHIDDSASSGVDLQLQGGQHIEAKNVIVANGTWAGKLLKASGYYLPIQDGKGYSMTLKHPVLKPTIPSILHEARVAITPMGDDLRISGTLEISGMDDGINPHRVNSILKAVPEYYPGIHTGNPGPVWFGYRPCTPDGLPCIGPMKKGSAVIIAAGHAMMGLSLAPVTGRIVSDILQNKQGKPHNKLDPYRFS